MKLLLLCCLLPSAFGAFNSTSVWEVRTGGSNSNGGAFDPGVASPGTDSSQQDAAAQAYTDIVVGGTTTQGTSAAHAFSSTSPGNFVNITAGSGCAVQRVEILSVSGSTATFDKSLGSAASTCTGSLGGGLLTISTATGLAVAGNAIYVRAGTYTIASGITVANAGTATNQISLNGYTSSHGDRGMATITASADMTVIYVAQTNWNVSNFTLTCAGHNCNCYEQDANNITASNLTTTCNVRGVYLNSGFGAAIWKVAVSGAAGTAGVDVIGGTAALSDITVTGGTVTAFLFEGGLGITCYRCIAANNTGASTDGFANSGATMVGISNSIAYANGRDGFSLGNTSDGVVNSASYGNGRYGINASSNFPYLTMANNAYGANTTAALHFAPAGAGDVTLSGDPFTAGVSNNFALNNTAGAGAALRGAGFPGVALTGGTGYLDIGAIQHQDPAGSAGVCAVAY